MAIQDLTDEALALEARQNSSAFGEVINRYEAKLRRYIRRVGVYGQEDVEDVLQDVFIKAYRYLHSFDVTLSFSSWIYRVAHNEAVSFLRKQSSRPQGHYVFDSEESLKRVFDDLDIENDAETSLNAEHISKALDGLKQKYKDVIILQFFEQRDYSEISDILKIPMGSVATYIHRAKKALKKELTHLTDSPELPQS